MDPKHKLGARRWISFILIGLVGQIAWAIENQYINLWVFSQSGDVNHITWMTVASAVMATVTTFFIGALSDRLGKRKIFIAGGYSVWGIAVFLFGVMSLSNMSKWANGDGVKALLLVGVMNTVIDCIMTFFGSTANDACFNAMVTDQTNEHNRPFVETVLSIMPLVGMAIMLGIGACLGLPGSIAAGETQQEYAARIGQPWLIFFLIFGLLTTLVGVLCFFLLPKDKIAPNRDGNYFKNIISGFRPKMVKANPLFYIALLAFLFFNIAVDSFMPYYLVYFTTTLGFTTGEFYLAMGIIMGVASAATVALGAFLDRIGALKVLIPAIAVMAAGALGIFFAGNSLTFVILSGVLLMSGYLLGTACLGATLRDQTPENEVGALQGVRMVFAVMLPMVIGSNLSAIFFQGTYTNDYGEVQKLPDRYMFLVALIAALLAVVPAVWLILSIRKKKAIKTVQE